MIDLREHVNSGIWYAEGGRDNDIVVSSRVRLSRNLAGYPFPGTISVSEEKSVEKVIEDAFVDVNSDNNFDIRTLSDHRPLQRRVWMERNYLSHDFIVAERKPFILRKDERISGMICEVDHLRTACFRGGLNLHEANRELQELDDKLEQRLNYAVSLEAGYLNTEILNIGTGVRASVMVHLPALVLTGLIEKVLKTAMQIGLTIKSFSGEEDSSLGNMYQVTNQFGFGLSEQEIMEKLEAVALQLVHYERKAREELLEKQRTTVEDKVFRALGLLTHCRTVTASEAIEMLATLRFGIALGLLSALKTETITSLLFYSQKAHIQSLIEEDDERAKNDYINYVRAGMIRTTLQNELGSEGSDV
ncbi:MAG: hypothetical protein K9L68_00895 [Spirochaetales bacterium]|nr:hypothetical protein [Spirochaetales bacterium]MCF7937132.1 hypothetical protein [Spirochaetales bacterium]